MQRGDVFSVFAVGLGRSSGFAAIMRQHKTVPRHRGAARAAHCTASAVGWSDGRGGKEE